MKKIVCSIVIIIIIIFSHDYYNSKYARGSFFKYHFISDNVMIFRMGSKTGYYTAYYTYFTEYDKSSNNKKILYQLYDNSPVSKPIFAMTECTNLGIHDSIIIGYTLINNQVFLSVNNNSLLTDLSCSVYDETVQLTTISPKYNTTNPDLPFIVNYRKIILLILLFLLTLILMIEIKIYSYFFYIFVALAVLLRIFFNFDGHLWILNNYFNYFIQALYLLSLPIMIFRAYKKKEIGIVIPMIILNIILVIYILL